MMKNLPSQFLIYGLLNPLENAIHLKFIWQPKWWGRLRCSASNWNIKNLENVQDETKSFWEWFITFEFDLMTKWKIPN